MRETETPARRRTCSGLVHRGPRRLYHRQHPQAIASVNRDAQRPSRDHSRRGLHSPIPPEEGDLRRRRGMDRERLVKRTLERIGGTAVVIAGTALKWGFVFAKFFGFFISAAAYSFWFHSWTFGVGLA